MIRIEDLKKTYDRRTRNAHRVLHGMSFTLPESGFVCILGASGCGKTSLLNAIGGLDAFDSGTILTDSTRITRSGSRAMEQERNRNFGYIFQNYYLLSEHSAAYNIYLGMHSMPLSKKEKMQRVKMALEKVDMLRYRKRPVGQLSGGQQQRIAIARAIAREPKVIFADEPTGNLDEANTMNICTILKELSRESLVVMVTHEERIAKFFADRIITLDDGRIVSDTTDWSRGTMDAGEKDAVYSGEYEESRHTSDAIDLRVLAKEGSAPVSLTIVTENDRILIKTDDPRVVLCSEINTSPKLIEGDRPILSMETFAQEAPSSPTAPMPKPKKRGKKGLGLRFLFREAGFLASPKRLGKIGTGIFIILLSLMISLSVSDIITVASIDPEDFITTDSHVLDLTFNRGEKLPTGVWHLDSYRSQFMDHLNTSGLDFDYVMKTNTFFEYKDSTVPQFGNLSMKLTHANYIHIDRLDESTLIQGRMPERSDEIVIDRWLVDMILADDGILQNVIPNSAYLLGKPLHINKTPYSPTIVGICDSGQPNMYLSTEAMLSLGTGGMEVVSFSEFCRLTGYSKYDSLENDECIVLADTAGSIFMSHIGRIYHFGENRTYMIKDALLGTEEILTAKYVVPDEMIPVLYREMIEYIGDFSVWCADKDAMLAYVGGELPANLDGMLDIDVNDQYQNDYDAYLEKTLAKADARTIITVTVFALSVVMLYLMQRSKMNERMDIVAVYRLLGIPKHNLTFIFAVESVTLTLKYAVPTVLGVWLVINVLSAIETIGLVMLFPVSAVLITLAAILTVRLILAVLPVLRLLSLPPARLAAKYDF